MRHLLDIFDLTAEEMGQLLNEAVRWKANILKGERPPVFRGRVLGLIFEKPSLRTRASFEAAMAQLGGSSIFLTGQDAGLGVRESIADFAQVFSQYVDAVVLRTFRHATVAEFAQHATVPTINGLSDEAHPCQALGDLLTIQEIFGDLAGRTVVFVGDGNNVARSLAVACGKLGVRFILSSPPGYGFPDEFLRRCQLAVPDADIRQIADPRQAVRSADIVYTDVWTSMGQESERKQRKKKFAAYQVNAELLAQAPAHAKVMHCLPAHREEEVTSAVLDGDRSVVIQQAANRLHAQRALLLQVLPAAAGPSGQSSRQAEAKP
ncbi:MAG: ornithine carbamoyltransferase [Gemmataceae bacterium]|nr:ornithine carbamoyltransferase [Gemmataceae bacterium]MDW8264495.1 ornithine carbamoyltransferase [Gemmataceae bacterium]